MARNISLETPEVRSPGSVPVQDPRETEGTATAVTEFLAPIGRSLGGILRGQQATRSADARAAAKAAAEDAETTSMINVINSMSQVYAGVRDRAVNGEFVNPGLMRVEVNQAFSEALIQESKNNPGFLTSKAIKQLFEINDNIAGDISKSTTVEVDDTVIARDVFGNTQIVSKLTPEQEVEENIAATVTFGQEFLPSTAMAYNSNLVLAQEGPDPQTRQQAILDADNTYARMQVAFENHKALELESIQAERQLKIFKMEEALEEKALRPIIDNYAESALSKISSTASTFFDHLGKGEMTGPMAASEFRGVIESQLTNSLYARMVKLSPEFGKNLQDTINAVADNLEASDPEKLQEWQWNQMMTQNKIEMQSVLNRLTPEKRVLLENAGAFQAVREADLFNSILNPTQRGNPTVMASASQFAAALGKAGGDLNQWQAKWADVPVQPDSPDFQNFVNDSTTLLFEMHQSLALWRNGLGNKASLTPGYVSALWNVMNQNQSFSANRDRIASTSVDHNTMLKGINDNLKWFSDNDNIKDAFRQSEQFFTDKLNDRSIVFNQ
jgi:hypothetical protein